MNKKPAVKKRKVSQGERLRRQGFDRSQYNRDSRTYRVACSQCQAMVINGVAVHERGCPNEPR